ncbi:ABC transporter ATP-binding protein [Brevibacillus borstelensis]|jgi:ATP-binding cassette subfamily B multidrug efflux pump|uniref:ABC transporter ATP-binding protein n=1 Tax=Brevibacillus borstelensis TaxID=45462 RepID=UPI000469DBE4|nr:ABC transporter ATP-binding protein [Brevibacillus borstelensis]MCM3560228.1 ABC transporter ATP-binding protein/permease [Brevibacillus borstelensis]MCM3590242.1 ABC transporter ATP-binding protein/permease [Brevibacillus borstelensis]MED1875994.1 ABC transporter ATP-binding protein [Brevibacillus borstelensis]WNF06546.1 ABC transporter ATP-binding protein [Brevibacillus borstelensis]
MSEQKRGMSPGAPGAGPGPGGHKGPMGFGGPGMLSMPGQKAKNFKGTLRRLLGYLKPYRMKLTAVLLTAALSTVFGIVSPKLLGDATTKLFEGFMAKVNGVPGAAIDFAYVWHIIMVLIGLYIASSAFAYIQQYLMAGVAQKTVYTLRKQVDEKLARLPLKYFDARSHGEVMSRVVNDVDTISGTLQQSLTQMITSIITLIGVIVMMLTISPLMTLILILTLPLSFVVIRAIASRSRPHFKGQQQALGELNSHVEEMYTGHKIVKAFGREQSAVQKFDTINERLHESAWKAQFISGIMMPLMMLVSNIGFVLVCVVGGVLVTRGSIRIGDVQAFIQYAQQFSQPITQTANIANVIQSTLAAAERVFEVLDEPEESAEPVSMAGTFSLQGHVRFEHVSFGYKEEEPLIRDMNIDVKPGMTVAIVGPTGAGKTTLVNLLMRFYEIGEGRITIDGRDIRELPRGELRSLFGMVLQDTWLFNGSIRENIAYGRAGATDEEVLQAAQAAHADHFVRTLPDGYDTILNEEASNISQGQKQLLTIARAFLADPAILILDEATSSVDTRTELLIQKAMSGLMEGRTSFVIAHRLSTIRDADLILVMNNGSVIEQGNHEELLRAGGFYAELYNSQFAGSGMAQQAG